MAREREREVGPHQQGLLVGKGKSLRSEDEDTEERWPGERVGDADDDGERGGGGGAQAEGPLEGAGGGIPSIGRHHEQPVAADSPLQVEIRVLHRHSHLHHAAAPLQVQIEIRVAFPTPSSCSSRLLTPHLAAIFLPLNDGEERRGGLEARWVSATTGDMTVGHCGFPRREGAAPYPFFYILPVRKLI